MASKKQKQKKKDKKDGLSQLSDFGCVVCMKLQTVFGKNTGFVMNSCSACHGPRQYCSKACFKKDWEEWGHREECGKLGSKIKVTDCTAKSKKAYKLKEEGNTFFKEGNYEAAIEKYKTARILAYRIGKTIRENRISEMKELAKSITLRDHLLSVKDIHPELEEELKTSHRPDTLENEMARLAAISANNIAVVYNKP